MTTTEHTFTSIAQLPEGYFWRIELNMRCDAAFVYLHKHGLKRRLNGDVASGCVVDIWEMDLYRLADEVGKKSKKVRDEYFQLPEDPKVWEDKARALAALLGSNVDRVTVRRA